MEQSQPTLEITETHAKRKVAVYITMSPTGICQYNVIIGKDHKRLKTEEIMKIL